MTKIVETHTAESVKCRCQNGKLQLCSLDGLKHFLHLHCGGNDAHIVISKPDLNFFHGFGVGNILPMGLQNFFVYGIISILTELSGRTDCI